NELGAEHIAVERIRALPVRDMDYAVVESDGQRHGHSSSTGTQARPKCSAGPAGDEPPRVNSLSQYGRADPAMSPRLPPKPLDLAAQWRPSRSCDRVCRRRPALEITGSRVRSQSSS